MPRIAINFFYKQTPSRILEWPVQVHAGDTVILDGFMYDVYCEYRPVKSQESIFWRAVYGACDQYVVVDPKSKRSAKPVVKTFTVEVPESDALAFHNEMWSRGWKVTQNG